MHARHLNDLALFYTGFSWEFCVGQGIDRMPLSFEDCSEDLLCVHALVYVCMCKYNYNCTHIAIAF